jgi:hypothetical protein
MKLLSFLSLELFSFDKKYTYIAPYVMKINPNWECLKCSFMMRMMGQPLELVGSSSDFS